MLRTPPPTWAVPVLETDRLILRAHTVADFEQYCMLWADPIVTHFISGKPSTAEETWSRLLRHAGHWSLLGFGSWWIEEKATGEMVGEVGFFDYRRNMEPALMAPEVGWILWPPKHGKGYATEAVAALLEWGRGRFASGELCCIIAPGNTASLRVAEKSGFVERSRTTYRDSPVVVMFRQFPEDLL